MACERQGPERFRIMAIARAVGAVLVICTIILVGANDESWPVLCNTDCAGINTCMENQLCVGEEVENGNCPENPDCDMAEERCAPVPCRWQAWSEWANDGVSGLCLRRRDFLPNRCGGTPCVGTVADTMYCDPVKMMGQVRDCDFSSWSGWSECNPKMLQRTRSRIVATPPAHGGRPCEGSLLLTEPCGVRAEPVDCELGDWMPWSGCSHQCGGGQQMRIRSIKTQALRGGRLCGVDKDENSRVLQLTRACNDQACGGSEAPQDCLLGAWSGWSECSGNQQRYREREVIRPAAHGGQACEGTSLKQAGPCPIEKNVPNSPIDCILSDWTPWTLCSRTCEGGQTARKRTIERHAENGGSQCEDSLSETMPCNDFPCNLDVESPDCALAKWSEWSSCSAQCGQGLEKRRRDIRIPAMKMGAGCNDPLEEVRPCSHVKSCERDDCKWGPWSQWGKCSQTCGGGHQKRGREVVLQPTHGGNPCEALESISEVKPCNTKPCYEDCIDGLWDSWTEWRACSRSCGAGVAWRSRNVAIVASPCGQAVQGELTDVKKCNEGTCEEDVDCKLGEWSSWSECSKSCDGVMGRNRKIEVAGKGAGKLCGNATDGVALKMIHSCNGPKDFMAKGDDKDVIDKMEECGFTGHEPVDCDLDVWEEWSNCSTTCDGGQKTRKRKIKALPQNGGKSCEDPLQQIAPCNAEPCVTPEDCEWGRWSEWSDCTRCDGERTRIRHIARHGNGRGKMCGESAATEVERCNECPKIKILHCLLEDWETGDCSVTCGTNGWKKKTRSITGVEIIPDGQSHNVIGNSTGDDAKCDEKEVTYVKCEDMPECDYDKCVAQDCEFSDWSEWNDPMRCDGLCSRSRTIRRKASCKGKQCSGALTQTQECPTGACGISAPCVFGDWGVWTTCDAGMTQRTRERTVDAEAGPSGESCDGPLKEAEACDEGSVSDKSDCKLSHWGAWSDCSKICGGGHQERSREVVSHAISGGKPCNATLRAMRSCNEGLCGAQAADCELSTWQTWYGCEASKNGGHQAIRKRSIEVARGDGRPCSGSILEAGECPPPEPIDCEWGEWAQWGDCGVPCGGGQRFRTREISQSASNGGNLCEGDIGQTEACNQDPCSSKDCQLSTWSHWSGCESNCGQGHQKRQRQVVQAALPDGNACTVGLEEIRGCTIEGGPCTKGTDCQWGEWSDWSDCFQAEYCGIGYRRRAREIAKHAEGLGELCLALPAEEVQSSLSCPGACDARSCVDAEWDDWGSWDQCSVTCGSGGVQSRARVLRVKANACGKPAEGNEHDFRACSSEISCEPKGPVLAQDCIFGSWTAWEPPNCPSPCNGEQRRSRTIVRYSANGGETCLGATSQTTRCNPAAGEKDPPGCESGAPVNCVLQHWSEWSACSAQCGTGHTARVRSIAQAPKFGGRLCENPLEEIHECNASKPCVDGSQDCMFADWEEWSVCDAITGQKKRKRGIGQIKLGFGQDCEGSRVEVRNCTRQCQDKHYPCGWASWSMWTSCSTTCGPEGRRTRVRQLELGATTLSPPILGLSETNFDRQTRRSEDVLVTKYAEITERLRAATSRRSRDVIFAFGGGAVTFIALLSLLRFTGGEGGIRRKGILGFGASRPAAQARSASREASEPFVQEEQCVSPRRVRTMSTWL